ncbi:DUF6036 family nucleotidyltransferase [Luteipulveratus mongoliensis]|uniref:DUF6036 family nucleotidyltransferase n=1 Tax=Luteipulveratus mongoliensis TaxID=571913 RepID=UPI000696DB9C|nr:DUF6036 family nucleotidyltransferase [Luteipulveratus mongoliensis]
MSRELPPDEIRDLLADLGDRLQDQDIHATVYVVGGAAIALRHSRSRTTQDVDAAIEPEREVLAIARDIAQERDLPPNWLNSSAGPYIPPRAMDGVHAEQLGGLTVQIAPAEHLLAMKLAAGRERDIDDLLLLADELGITTAEEAVDVVAQVYDVGQLEMIVPDGLAEIRYFAEHLTVRRDREVNEPQLKGDESAMSERLSRARESKRLPAEPSVWRGHGDRAPHRREPGLERDR